MKTARYIITIGPDEEAGVITKETPEGTTTLITARDFNEAVALYEEAAR